ncbi:hypothetical protein KAR91_62700 [Candidatus Pacearchaeota archaeon]|nr:hypothetical protein [Candidatus Pacearchaeota archaeon]
MWRFGNEKTKTDYYCNLCGQVIVDDHDGQGFEFDTVEIMGTIDRRPLIKESILNTDMHLCLRCIDQVVKIFGDQNEKS